MIRRIPIRSELHGIGGPDGLSISWLGWLPSERLGGSPLFESVVADGLRGLGGQEDPAPCEGNAFGDSFPRDIDHVRGPLLVDVREARWSSGRSYGW